MTDWLLLEFLASGEGVYYHSIVSFRSRIHHKFHTAESITFGRRVRLIHAYEARMIPHPSIERGFEPVMV